MTTESDDADALTEHCTLEIPVETVTRLCLFSMSEADELVQAVAATLRWRECRINVPVLPQGSAAFAISPNESAVSFMFMDTPSAVRVVLAAAALQGLRLRSQARAAAEACAAAPPLAGLPPRHAKCARQRLLHAVRSRNAVMEALSVLRRACAGGLLEGLQGALNAAQPWQELHAWLTDVSRAFADPSSSLHDRSISTCLACLFSELMPIQWAGPPP